MPVASLYLISVRNSVSLVTFIQQLQSDLDPKPILVARTLRWIISPWISSPDDQDKDDIAILTSTKWDLLVIFPVTTSLPESCVSQVEATYSIRVGIPSKLLDNFSHTNSQLLNPRSVPDLTASLHKTPTSTSSKDLELTSELKHWFSRPSTTRGPVSMLNFLTFKPGKHDTYKQYGSRFASDIGIRRGGIAKIVGKILIPREGYSEEKKRVWDEIAVAHYPSCEHWADMAISKDYQDVNAKYRIPAVAGTAILCCDELDGEVQIGLKASSLAQSKI